MESSDKHILAMQKADESARATTDKIERERQDRERALAVAHSPLGQKIRRTKNRLKNSRGKAAIIVGSTAVLGAGIVIANSGNNTPKANDTAIASTESPSVESMQSPVASLETTIIIEQPSISIPSVKAAIRDPYSTSKSLYSCAELLQRAGVITADESCSDNQELTMAITKSALEQAANSRTGVWFRNFPIGYDPVDRAALAFLACTEYTLDAAQSDVADLMSTGRYALSADSAAVLAGDSLQNICPQQ